MNTDYIMSVYNSSGIMQHKVTGVAILIAVPSLYEANPATASETQLLL